MKAKMSKKTKTLPNPGSDIAIEMGCLCPIFDNCHGKGAYDGKDGMYWINEECPLHGGKHE